MPPVKQKIITIRCDTPEAEIRYTTDNSEPSESSNLYANEFEVEPPVTIKARAYKDGYEPSDIAEYDAKIKLPNPEDYITFCIHGSTITIENIHDYPDNVIFHADDGNIQIQGSKTDIGEKFLSGTTIQVWATCENYEDSNKAYFHLP